MASHKGLLVTAMLLVLSQAVPARGQWVDDVLACGPPPELVGKSGLRGSPDLREYDAASRVHSRCTQLNQQRNMQNRRRAAEQEKRLRNIEQGIDSLKGSGSADSSMSDLGGPSQILMPQRPSGTPCELSYAEIAQIGKRRKVVIQDSGCSASFN